MDEGVVLYPVAGPDLAYAPDKDDGVDEDRLLGFNGSRIPHTAWAVIAWVATQYAKPGQNPVFWYDNEQVECEITQDPKIRTGNFMVDPGGVFLPNEDKIPGLPSLLFASKMKKKAQAHAQEREWIQGLHDRWQARPNPTSDMEGVGSKKPMSP